ncbi:OmpA family protein [Marinobacter zhejiangensis]|uniref:OmpA-OmpF porin, OOP family n=1 Tax=Marinobacter zhejiangensis TaxID=488535 RepID=A0A1I4L8E4_9GAMM|nr:OmpA family protein [Marinobacter zhejiangensis]SFL87139.1 OmpA-OmpF porin, OOP family [Marinobacter zhejiangensis]
MPSMRPLAIAVVAAAISTPTLAEDKDYIYLNPFAAYQYFDDKRDLSETGTFGFGLEYRFAPHWAVEALYSRANADRKYTAGNSDFEELRLDGLYYFAAPEKAWNPYLAVGAGHADFGDELTHSPGTNHEETRVNVGGGVRYNVTEMVSLRGDLREFHGIDESTFDTQVSLGFSLAFGKASSKSEPAPVVMDSDNDGVEDNQDQCPSTPAGAAVDSMGCELDNDRDGVANSADQCPATPAGANVDAKGCETDGDNDGVVDSKDECPNTAAGAEVDAKGCEGIAETIETFEIEVQFPTNSAEIGGSYDAQIQRVATFMNENPETIVEIAGHTDSAGNADYNQALSQRRAESVARRLTENLGVEAERVTAVGYGEAEPVADNGTAAGRAENRRVEARIQVRR